MPAPGAGDGAAREDDEGGRTVVWLTPLTARNCVGDKIPLPLAGAPPAGGVVEENEELRAGVAAEMVVAPSGDRAGDKRPLNDRAVAAVALLVLVLV
jgi:hypothetical protein